MYFQTKKIEKVYCKLESSSTGFSNSNSIGLECKKDNNQIQIQNVGTPAFQI